MSRRSPPPDSAAPPPAGGVEPAGATFPFPGGSARATWDGRSTEPADDAAAISGEPAASAVPEGIRYVAGGVLGVGGMGEVRAAQDLRLRRDVALKVLLRDAPAARARFEAEAQVTAQLDHPNIVPVYDLGADADGRPFLAMKRVRGRSLAALLADPEPLDRTARLEIFLKVCDAVAFAHARGVLHRDIKCENVMVGAFGEVLLMDWGLARPFGAASPPAPDESVAVPLHVDRFEVDALRTREGQVAGTPAYMAPEQASGRLGELGPRTDVYSLGAVLYVLVTGRPPFEGPADRVLADVRAGRFVPPSAAARVPRELDAVVLKAMALRPADRYPSVQALQEDVAAFLARRPLVHLRSTLLERGSKWVERHRASVRAAGLVATLAVSALLIGLWRYAADVGDARDRAVTEATRALSAEEDARVQLVAAQLALADSHTEQGAMTAAGDALRDADRVARGLSMDHRPLDWALSAHSAVSPPPVATCDVHGGRTIVGLAVAALGDRVASLGSDGRLLTWALAGCEIVSELDLGDLGGDAMLPGPLAGGTVGPSFTRARLALTDDGVRGLVLRGDTVVPIWAGRPGAPWPVLASDVVRLTLDGEVGLVSLREGDTVRLPLAGGEALHLGVAQPDHAAWWPMRGLRLVVSLPSGSERGGALPASGGLPRFATLGVTDLDASPDGRWLLVATAFGHEVLDLMSAANGGTGAAGCPSPVGLVAQPGGSTRATWCRTDRATVGVIVSDDGRLAIATRYDGSVDVDQLADGAARARIEGDGSGTVRPVAASPDGRVLAMAIADGVVRVHAIDEREPMRVPVHFSDVGHAVAVAHDGRLLALGDDSGTLTLVDRATGAVLAVRSGYAPGIRHLVFSADDRRLLAGLRSGAAAIFDLVDDSVRVVPVGGRAPSLDWVDARTVAAVSTLGVAYRIDADAGTATPLGSVLPCSTWGGTSIPGTRWLAVDGHAQSGARDVVVLDVDDGRIVSRRAVDASRYRIAASPDGRLLVSGTQDGHLEVWNPATGAVVRSLAADGGPTLGVAWSPDGSLVASTGFDGTIDLWDAERWTLLRSVPTHNGPGTAVVFTPDGASVLASGGFGAVLFPLDAHLRHAKAVAALSSSADGRPSALAALGLWGQVEAALDTAKAEGAPDDPVLRARARLVTGGDAAAALGTGSGGAWEALLRRLPR